MMRKAEAYFARLEKQSRRRIDQKLRAVCEDPLNERHWVRLAGRSDGLRRSRVGDLRILFYVRDDIEVLQVTEIGPRGDIYKGS